MSARRTRKLLAPAKINLFLRVVGRRADGYHLLDSLMVPVDLYDEVAVSFVPGPERQVSLACDSPEIPAGRDNLAYRAAEIFLDRGGVIGSVDVHLSKRIPAGSGLGGGSSDAAAVLIALNALSGSPVTTPDLARWAADLGADVPFFVYGRPAQIQGIGEIVTPVAGWAGVPLVIGFPGIGLSTHLIYARYDASRGCSGGQEAGPVSLTKTGPETSIADFTSSRRPLRELLVNDLEAVAVEVRPELRLLKDLLLKLGARGALMTGSGAAVYGIWRDRPAAEEAAKIVRNRGIWAVAAETLALSPAVA